MTGESTAIDPTELGSPLTAIETDWQRGVAYVGMPRARTRLHVIIHLPRHQSFV